MARNRIPRAQMSEEERERQKAVDRSRYQRTQEMVRATKKNWRTKNRTKVNAQQLRRKHARIDKYRSEDNARHKKYRKADPEAARAYCRAMHAKHKPKRNVASKLYYETHKEILQPGNRARSRLHYHANTERYKAYAKLTGPAWRRKNREKLREQEGKRRALERNAPINDFTRKQWRALCQATGYRCAYCQKKFAFADLTQDHITPLSKGGSHTLSNIIPCCFSCNSRKKDRAVLCPVQPFLLVDEAAAD